METILEFLQRNWFFLVIIAGLLYALYRQRRKVTDFATRQEFELLVNTGYPIVAEFFDET
jgi:hypothetical protein